MPADRPTAKEIFDRMQVIIRFLPLCGRFHLYSVRRAISGICASFLRA